MTKFDVLMEQMISDEKLNKRLYALDRLYIEFTADFDKVIERALQRGDDRLKLNLAFLLSERGDGRGDKMVAEFFEKEMAAASRDFEHWLVLGHILDFYAKKKNAGQVSRFFPVMGGDARLDSTLVQAARDLKLKAAVPALLKAAKRRDAVYKTDEYAIVALGELAGAEAEETLLKISQTGGAVNKRVAKEALEKIKKRHKGK